MFKMLFRDELYTLEDMQKMAEKNPDVLWVVYESNGRAGSGSWCHHGTMQGSAIVEKFG
jgi:hypothetical protein